MKSLFIALALVAVSVAADAANPFVQTLWTASDDLHSAMYQSRLDMSVTATQMRINARLGAVTSTDANQVAAAGDPSPVVAAGQKARADGIAAYKAWIVGKSPADQAAAKKLLVAYLTYLDTIEGCPCDDPADQLAESNGQNAFNEAVNEFRVDTGDL